MAEGQTGTFWGIRRERSPLAGGVTIKGRGNSGRFQKEGEKGGGQTLTFIQRILSEYPLQARLGAALGWDLPPCLASASWALVGGRAPPRGCPPQLWLGRQGCEQRGTEGKPGPGNPLEVPNWPGGCCHGWVR